MASSIERPAPGIETWVNPRGIRVLRLHYSADPEKGGGEKVWNERQNAWLSPWADAQERAMTNAQDFQQEYEINFGAKLGTLVYQFLPEASVEKPFPIPE